MPRTIVQTVSFKGSPPQDVYAALMDSRKHSLFTRAKARMSNKPGGKFSAYDGYIEGTNLVVVQNRKIVQLWRGSDWPQGHYARTTFQLSRTKSGTRLRFRQSNVPDAQYASIKQGWIDFYWKPLKVFLGKEGRRL